MKSLEELKQELHELIDSIDDEATLNELHEGIEPYLTKKQPKDTKENDELTEEQWRELEQAMQQVKEGKTITLEEFYSRMKSWHTK